MEDAAVFVAFESFDFEGNATFQKGWSSLKTLFASDPEAREREYIRAKAFYFSKYIESFDFEKYKAWKSQNGSVQQNTSTEDRGGEGRNPKGDTTDSCSRTGKDASRLNDLVPDSHAQKSIQETKQSASCSAGGLTKQNDEPIQRKKENQYSGENSSDVDDYKSRQETQQKLEKDKNEVDSETEQKEDSLSLAELAMLVQNGLPIPGLISVDVQPTNKNPTPSAMSRKPKPWEMKTK